MQITLFQRNQDHAQQKQGKRGGFALESGIVEKFCPDNKCYHATASADQRNHRYRRIVHTQSVEIGVVCHYQQYSGQRDAPLPFELVFLPEAIPDGKSNSQNQHQIHRKVELQQLTVDFHNIEQIFIEKCGDRAEQGPGDDQQTAFAFPVESFGFTDEVEADIAGKNYQHADSLLQVRDFVEQQQPADGGPHGRGRPDGGGEGDRQFTHGIENAYPTAGNNQRFEEGQQILIACAVQCRCSRAGERRNGQKKERTAQRCQKQYRHDGVIFYRAFFADIINAECQGGKEYRKQPRSIHDQFTFRRLR